MINYVNPTIDLVRTYDMYESKNKPKKWCHSFGWPIVGLAIGVVGGWPHEEHLHGIRKCLEYEILKLRKREYFLRIPMGYTDLGNDIKINKNQHLIVDSLVFSVIEFYDHLHEHGTGMSQIARTKLRRGFELACLWGGYLELLDSDKIIG